MLKDKIGDVLKISDFGLSRMVSEASFMKTLCGTPQYVGTKCLRAHVKGNAHEIAPEVLDSIETDGYGKACDLWSIGVILYIMYAP